MTGEHREGLRTAAGLARTPKNEGYGVNYITESHFGVRLWCQLYSSRWEMREETHFNQTSHGDF